MKRLHPYYYTIKSTVLQVFSLEFLYNIVWVIFKRKMKTNV